MADNDDKPVLTGLVALVSVALVVGLLVGFTALLGTRLLGVAGGSGGGAGEPVARDSLYLPDPVTTSAPAGPLVTLAPTDDEETAAATSTAEPTGNKKRRRDRDNDQDEESRIVLSAGQLQVSQMERIDLTGVYPGGEGAILEVQRFENGRWTDFYSVSANVSNETFSTYVETSRSGVNRFRMYDPDKDLSSNEVRVTVG